MRGNKIQETDYAILGIPVYNPYTYALSYYSRSCHSLLTCQVDNKHLYLQLPKMNTRFRKQAPGQMIQENITIKTT